MRCRVMKDLSRQEMLGAKQLNHPKISESYHQILSLSRELSIPRSNFSKKLGR